MKKRFFAVLLVLTAVSVYAQSGGPQTKTGDIQRLFEVINIKEQAERVFDLIIPQFRAIAPQVPDEFWELFRENLDFDSFIAMYIPLYDKYYSHDDIKGLIVFYESPIGKKILSVTPRLMAESLPLGQAWGFEVAQKILQQMKKEGYIDA